MLTMKIFIEGFGGGCREKGWMSWGGRGDTCRDPTGLGPHG